jgi:amino acid permease
MVISAFDIGIHPKVDISPNCAFVANCIGPVVNGINGFGQVFVLASAYYVGTEIISLAAGETKDPRKSIPTVCLLAPL